MRLISCVTTSVLLVTLSLSGCFEVPSNELELTKDGPHILDRCLRIPAPERKGGSGGLPATFQLLNWNIQKTTQSGWLNELTQQASKADLILLQESVDSTEMQAWLQTHEQAWQQVIAFRYEGQGAGVMTASRQQDVYSCSSRMPEPTTRIPKSMLVTVYPLDGSRYPLLVVNVHAVNVELGIASYREQIKRIAQWIKKYPGPVIVAGDFNTWSAKRMFLLRQLMSKQRMQEVGWQPDLRSQFGGHILDHVFYRGLRVQAAVVEATSASDHNPMRVTFSL